MDIVCNTLSLILSILHGPQICSSSASPISTRVIIGCADASALLRTAIPIQRETLPIGRDKDPLRHLLHIRVERLQLVHRSPVLAADATLYAPPSRGYIFDIAVKLLVTSVACLQSSVLYVTPSVISLQAFTTNIYIYIYTTNIYIFYFTYICVIFI